MDRLQAWESLSKHAWHSKTMKKLSASEKQWSKMFIQDNDQLTTAQFRAKVHHYGLDRVEKTRTEVLELLSAANSAATEIKGHEESKKPVSGGWGP
jgi:hypothetical protein